MTEDKILSDEEEIQSQRLRLKTEKQRLEETKELFAKRRRNDDFFWY